MGFRRNRICGALAVLLALGATVAGATAEHALPNLDSIFSPLANRRSPGIAVLVRKNGRTIFERGYGVRDLRSFVPIDRAADFRLASCTKQFTAMATMLLAHDGKLRYETRLTDIFPDFPAYGRSITVRHLLTHTSGLPDYEGLMGEQWTEAHQIRDEEVLALLERQTSPKFAAGTSWAYSNSGYVLLGLIVAKVSGRPFDEFLRERIFDPLHMTGTLAFVKGKNTVPNRVFGYARKGDAFVETDQSPTSATLGDGGVYSNLADLAKWDAALARHTLLSAREMPAALTPAKLADGAQPHWPATPGDDNLNPGRPVSYGFGWFLDPYQGRPRMWHTGTTVGFHSAIERFTTDKLTIIVLCNRTDLDPNELALRAAKLLSSPATE